MPGPGGGRGALDGVGVCPAPAWVPAAAPPEKRPGNSVSVTGVGVPPSLTSDFTSAFPNGGACNADG